MTGTTKSGPIPDTGWATTLNNGTVTDTVTIQGIFTAAGAPVTFTVTNTQVCTVTNGAPTSLNVDNANGALATPNASFQSLGSCTGISFSQITIRRANGTTFATRAVSGGPPTWTTTTVLPNNWTDNNLTYDVAVSFAGGSVYSVTGNTALTSGTTTVWQIVTT